jgi:tetratricopeptide (TPR) repeat protein
VRKRVYQLSIALIFAALVGACARRAPSSGPELSEVERQLNRIYSSHRPFAYRWMGAPSAGSLPKPDESPQDLHDKIAEFEKAGGQTARSQQLHGRAYLLQGNFQKAVARYRLALVLDPNNPALQLELGISFALRARAENRPLDYEFALEHVLQSARTSHTPEAWFDSALLFEEAQLLLQASERWETLLAGLERSDPWYNDVAERRKKLDDRLKSRSRRIKDLTDSSASYLAHAQEAHDSIELVIEKALADWLPDAGKPDVQKALERLAGELENQHHDPWLKELLKVLPSPDGKRALQHLSDAWKENMSGDHEQAENSATEAEKLFKNLGNASGALRSRMELIYSFHRRGQWLECLEALRPAQKPELIDRYPWMSGQAELEKISCETLDRMADGVARREAALQRIAPMHYEALRLRALGFTTERCVCLEAACGSGAEHKRAPPLSGTTRFPICVALSFITTWHTPPIAREIWRRRLHCYARAPGFWQPPGTRSSMP